MVAAAGTGAVATAERRQPLVLPQSTPAASRERAWPAEGQRSMCVYVCLRSDRSGDVVVDDDDDRIQLSAMSPPVDYRQSATKSLLISAAKIDYWASRNTTHTKKIVRLFVS
ncbi:hypothetical protein RB195_004994 [Necator americanus]|uniref:Uncharacterized protein n=1 Tax=Necator americanus TaxID=51031 RepID=A0ABR1BKQ2_NECAM